MRLGVEHAHGATGLVRDEAESAIGREDDGAGPGSRLDVCKDLEGRRVHRHDLAGLLAGNVDDGPVRADRDAFGFFTHLHAGAKRP